MTDTAMTEPTATPASSSDGAASAELPSAREAPGATAGGDGDILISEFEKNGREIVRVRLTEYRGVELVDVRAFYQGTGGEWKPGKGIALRRELLSALIKALRAAEKAEKAIPGGPA